MAHPYVTIAIDSSTTNCGIAIYENGVFKDSLNISFLNKYSLDKLIEISNWFSDFFSENPADLLIIEETVPSRFSRAVTGLNQVFGAIVAVANSHNIHVNQLHNQKVKSHLNFKTKEEAIKLAFAFTGRGNLTEHEADAVLLVETYKELYT